MTILHRDDLDDFVLGATLLGSGGGGEASAYRHNLAANMPVAGVELVQLQDAVRLGLTDIAPVGMIGATSVLMEKLPNGGEIAEAVRAICRWTGRTVRAVMPVEAAGLNAALAVSAACQLGLPLIDADLMGRALPRFDQLSTIVDNPGLMRSVALCEPSGQVVVVDRSTPWQLERTVRSYVANAGGWAGAAFGPVTVTELLGRTCEGTLARAITLGGALTCARPRPDTWAQKLGGIRLASGRVIEVVRGVTDRFGRSSVAVDDRSGFVLRIEAENEYLVAVRDGEPAVTCPELICVVDGRTAQPIFVERLRFGDDVQVLALPGPRWWTSTPERLAAVGPRAFGIDLDPVLLNLPVRKFP